MIGIDYQGGKVLWVSMEEWEKMSPYVDYTTHLFETLLTKADWGRLFYTLQNGVIRLGPLKISARASRYNNKMKLHSCQWYLSGGNTGWLFLISKDECEKITRYPTLREEDWDLLDTRHPDRGQTPEGKMAIRMFGNFLSGGLPISTGAIGLFHNISREPWEKNFPAIFPTQMDITLWNASARRVVEGFVRSKVPYGTVAKLLGVAV